jgi:hypothetical protein
MAMTYSLTCLTIQGWLPKCWAPNDVFSFSNNHKDGVIVGDDVMLLSLSSICLSFQCLQSFYFERRRWMDGWMDGWMDELGLYNLYFCTGKANQDSQGQQTIR